MAIVIDSVPIIGLRVVHFHQLMQYLEDRDIEEWYYGNREQFETRHEDLRQWLTNIIELVDSPDIRIPKKKETK